MIGDPTTRYREDPVRMLRAARFAAKLDFRIDEATRAPMAELADLLENVPPSRLFDEMLKLLLSGHALRGVHQLRAEGLHHGVLPLLDAILDQPEGERFITAALHNTDLRVQAEKPVSPAFLFATLLWHELQSDYAARIAAGEKPSPALFEAMDAVLDRQRERLAVPRRLDGTMKEIWSLAAAFRTTFRQPPVPFAVASALSCRLRLSAAARPKRRSGAGARSTGGRISRMSATTRAPKCCCPNRPPAQAQAPQAQAQTCCGQYASKHDVLYA